MVLNVVGSSPTGHPKKEILDIKSFLFLYTKRYYVFAVFFCADENRSIGIILCAEKDRVEVELALEDMGKPIGVADYQLIVPKTELEEVLTNEIRKFGEEKSRK